MSQTLSEPTVHAAHLDAPSPRRRWTRWPKYFLLFLIFLWVADFGISLLIRHTRLQKRLTARLESVFGRSVEVGRYTFSLWGGPTLEAQSVTFSEDPRFGYEYFLRAESLTVRLRWESLFRGHLQLGTISLVRPSLNLVRNADGDWNVAEWLPKPSGPSVANSSSQPSTIRFGRIEVDSGRINFKRASEKLPFALVNVSGYLEPDDQGRWTMNLSAVPTRAAVVVQQAGTIYVSGHVGGTSSRLRPAVLDLAWGDAALSDVLRLARGYDFGVRGNLALLVHADTESDNWLLQIHAELRQLHRWDLALRPDNPALNLNAKMTLYPLASGLDITDATFEAPHSRARAHAKFSWQTPTQFQRPPKEQIVSPDQIEITQSQVDLSDVLAWIRAFHSEVASDLALSGSASVHAAFSVWPPRLTSAAGAVAGADFTSSRLRVPVHLGQTQFRYDHEIFTLLPSTVAYGASDGSLRLETIAHAGSRDFPVYHLSGNLTQVRDLVATAGVLGWNISRGWDLTGPVRCDLRWLGAKYPWQTQPVGTIEWGGQPTGASLLTPFLNQPVMRISARADLKPGSHHIALTAADAFGAHWTGTFDRRDASTGWQFSLVADHLATSDLDRWLNPRWRESFFDRVLPFLNSASPANAVPENLRAQGQIAVDQFTTAPLVVRHLQGDLKIGGRHLQLSAAKAQFYGGSLDGSLDAELTAIPSYRIHLDYSHVDLAALTSGYRTLDNAFSGSASGGLTFDFHGADRADLVSSLECRGNASVTNPQIKALNLVESLRQGEFAPGASSFAGAAAEFACHDGKITVQNLALVSPGEEITGSGSVDFSRNLNLRLRAVTASDDVAPLSPSNHLDQNDAYELTGGLQSPTITLARQRPNKP
ncbi:MAG: AsmA family protein [Candidatus Acidiferrales bacterium]